MARNNWTICETKRHNYIFKMPIPCTKCCLPFVSFSNPDKIVGSLKVNLCEEFFFSKAFQELSYKW
ncbi:hypothetical protein KP509_20G012300 [Ceratopteris richardii]|uniref:Uncharacterized protein n=1 Tax=Ceratopteris richardii TaxID=49495 RepID=A0A8T2SEY3_CERRI|nr:hypothetical protein KP509_20G012300 [Ceratopteris richardii]